ncbi:LicD family protein [Butyrivibrio sp. LC3010]|uniref:LicD family protein n=1 Tax=Butyrivibrio sp. LC3010 TaxID=1280680 RepID=UPI00041E20D2|nr:LicD family protein [Butyrivibrio sp. LC3010]
MSNEKNTRAQQRLLYMANTIEGILNSNEIPHSIIYGTLLGAVRHGGFIPWDDDFDFCVFDEVYDEAIRCLRKELPEDLFVEDETTEPLFFHAWAHVKDLNTVAYSKAFLQDNAYAHHGLSIDLYRMKKVKFSDMYEEAERQYDIYIEKRKKLGLMSDEEYKRRVTEGKAARERWYNRILVKSEKNNEDTERYIYCNIYTSLFRHEIDDFFPLKKYKFEDLEFWGPNNGDKMLKHWYGNSYMNLPPVERRVAHFDSVKFLD